MRTAIIYEGSHGGSAAIARLIAAEAAGHGPVIVGEVGEIPVSELEGVDFLVVGGPTHRCEQSGDGGRSVPAAHVLRETHPPTNGLRHWLDRLPARPGFSAATFDTREPGLRVLTGTAALGLYRALRRHGCHLVTRPASFLVGPQGSELLEGERERATTWAVAVFRRAEHHHPVRVA
ncbi:MAG TPA: flavodoxin [Candidatus Binatia bacterium]|nr:flavodoxin [Candidatus Binatia bacterium]